MRKWADLLEADAAQLAPIEAVGSTRTLAEVRSWDLPYAAECLRFYGELADKVGGMTAPTVPDRFGFTIREPHGVVGAIVPWNWPLVMAAWKLAPAIAAGNSVVLKPSELTPFSAVRMAELAIEAGLPPGVLNIVQGDGRSTGDALCRHDLVSKMTFTGSTETGQAIMRACAESGPKPVSLELGGKSPQVVFGDARDLEEVSAIVARSITLNAGQVCVAGSRLIVEECVHDEVIDRITKAFESHLIGPTWEARVTMGPIISERQVSRIEQVVTRSIAAGADVLSGGGRQTGVTGGFYHQPTLLTGLRNESEAVVDEIFGPVLTVQTFSEEAEAFSLANDSRFGLAAGVYTADLDRSLRAVRTLEAGTVWVNGYKRTMDIVLPTGGFKRSGVGKDLGLEAYSANLRCKAVLIHTS